MGEPPSGYPSDLYTSELKPKEHAFQLYAHRVDATTIWIEGGNWLLNWRVYDGTTPDAKLVARLQGIYHANDNATADLVFTDERFPSTLKIAGHFKGTSQLGIVGGTGIFAMAQGIVKHKQTKISTELGIRAMVPTLGKTVPVTKEGPWGSGDSGRVLDLEDRKEQPLKLESVIIGSGDAVDSIEFSYIDEAGNKHTVGPWGGPGGTKTTIPLAPMETVTKMAGTTADFEGNTVVTSISFATNVRPYGPYGIERGDKFNTAAGDNIIVGFYVRASHLVNSIGVYIRKKE